MWTHVGAITQPSTVVKGEEEKMERKEGIGRCDGGDERKEKSGGGGGRGRFSPYQGLSFLLCKMGRMSASTPRGGEDSAELLNAGGFSAQLPPWPVFSLHLSAHPPPSRVFPYNSHFLASHRKCPLPCNLPSPDPGPMPCSLILRTACWLLCPAHSSPSLTHHFQSLQHKKFCQIHLGCLAGLQGS